MRRPDLCELRLTASQGRVGALLGDEVVYGEPGNLIFKPRDQWHTFWNAGDEPARILEIISPAGFERYFGELTEFTAAVRPTPNRSPGSRRGTASSSISRACPV